MIYERLHNGQCRILGGKDQWVVLDFREMIYLSVRLEDHIQDMMKEAIQKLKEEEDE